MFFEFFFNYFLVIDGFFVVNGCDVMVVNFQIGRQGLCVGLKSLVEFFGFGCNRCEGCDIVNGVGSGEFGVWQEVVSELVEVFVDLEVRQCQFKIVLKVEGYSVVLYITNLVLLFSVRDI